MALLQVGRDLLLLKLPIMLIDSQYDRISIEKVLEIACINRETNSLSQCSTAERNFLEEYRSRNGEALFTCELPLEQCMVNQPFFWSFPRQFEIQ